MFKKQVSPYVLQWIVLAIAAALFSCAFLLTNKKSLKKSSDVRQPPIQTGQGGIVFIAPPSKLTVSSAEEVWDYYQEIGFTMENLVSGEVDVPRIYLANIVNTWAEDKPVTFKKSLFYRTMLPLILRVNEHISAKRTYLKTLLKKKQEKELQNVEAAWLRQLAVEYKVIKTSYKGPLTENHLASLVQRVDIIPTSMALGQAAYESAYATSRFAMEGNALFGQWRWGKGIRPAKQREELGDYRIADFEAPLDSMAAFAKNLNTNKAYKEFRRLRSEMRRRNKPLNGYILAAGLEKYSEKGKAYVETLRGMIDQNNLTMLDRVKLDSSRPVHLVADWDGTDG